MKYGIISDIHSNIHAYKEAIRLLSRRVGAIVCLGDIVGYNANPKECIVLTRERKKIKHVIKGNHDVFAYIGLRMSIARELSQDAYDGLNHTLSCLTEEDKAWIYGLKDYLRIDDKNLPFLAVHGAPSENDIYDYILDKYTAYRYARSTYETFGCNLCFFGHTHVPTYFKVKADFPEKYKFGSMSSDFYLGAAVIEDGESQTYDVSDPDSVYMINPGSIGQPRADMHSFAIFDSKKKTVEFECFEYDRESAIQAVLDAGYSEKIAKRLEKEDY